MRQVLLVEDEVAIADTLVFALNGDGYSARHVVLGAEALQLLRGGGFDLVILDVGLPDMTGFEALRQLRQFSQVPVMFLTARGGEIDRVVGLEIGADDYVVKPFSVRELAARVRALLRRVAEVAALRAQVAAQGQPAIPGLSVDPARRRASLNGVPLELRPREFELLALLARHPGQVFSREALLRQVWGHDSFVDARTVDVHIRRLRASLAAVDPAAAERIQTERGVGYRLADG